MDNKYYAQVLKEVGVLMKIKGENRFKIRAFENASRAIDNLTEPIEDVIARDEVTAIEGVGKSIARDIAQIQKTGTCEVRTALLEALDPGLLDLMKIQGLGPKRVKTLYDELNISNLARLKKAAEGEEIRELSGFGKKTEEKILAEIERLEAGGGRTPLPRALSWAETFRDRLAARDDVERVEIAGSIRRQRETIGDIDLVVASRAEPGPIMQAFIDTPGVDETIVHGDKKTSIRTVQGIQIDLRVVAPELFGSALHYFTGSKEHHVKLRTRAKRRGLKINEYGVFRDDEDTPIASQTEEELYEALGLTYIPPELREGFDEIERAEQGELPALVSMADIHGDLHMHTVESDGEATILEMAQAAQALGYEYIVLTDHSQVLTVANGMTPARFAAHIEAIREVDRQLDGFRVLAGIEVDILRDGTLDMDHDLLAECDWVVGSIHLNQNLDREAMTDRLLRALDTGLLSSLGHPTGRILGGRPGYDYDLYEVLAMCVAQSVAVEINGSPGRLDFNADHARRARELGARLVLGSDAHSTQGLTAMSYAVGQARRAGLTCEDVVNCLSAEELWG